MRRLAALRLALGQRASAANAVSNHRAVSNALVWLDSFAAWMPIWHLFIAHDLYYNAETFALLVEFMRESGSRKAGVLKATELGLSTSAAPPRHSGPTWAASRTLPSPRARQAQSSQQR